MSIATLSWRRRPRVASSVIPGFSPTLGFTLFYLSLIVLLPLAALLLKAAGAGWAQWGHILGDSRVLSALWLSFGGAFAAALRRAPSCSHRGAARRRG